MVLLLQKKKMMAKKINNHILLLKLIREDIISDFPDLKTKSHNSLLRMIFKNYRAGKGIHLTEFGFTYMGKKINFWSFSFGEKFLNTRHFLFLERSEKYPYHYNIRENKFYTTSPDLAMLLKLHTHPDVIVGEK